MTDPVRLAPDGVSRAAASPRRWWALTPPFHPYHRHLRRERYAVGGLLSVPLSVGFRRLACASILPCGVRTFLDQLPKRLTAITRPALRILALIPGFLRLRAGCCIRGRRRCRRARASRTPRRRGIPARRRATARRAPDRACGAGTRRSLQLPEDPHDAPKDVDVLGVDRFH